MSLQPITREALQSFKAKQDEENRINKINQIVNSIYIRIIQIAKSSSDTIYKTQIPTNFKQTKIDEFYFKNMSDILDSLRTLFPDCIVKHTIFIKGQDGKMYDLSTINMDETMKPLINQSFNQEYIVVDWS